MAVNVAGLRRNLKNIAHNYTDAQVKVREATSNDPWGPSSTLMSEIADMTYNVVAFSEIMQMIWKRLNDHGKNWRHVYKALVLLEYLIKTGSDKVAQQCKENIYAIQTLKDFQYFEECKDYGMSVREKSKSMVALLNDDERLQSERAKALKAKERFHQAMGHGSDSEAQREVDPDPKPPGWGTRPLSTDLESARPSTIGEEELQLQLALAMSKEEAEREEERRKSDELRLQLALNKSKDDTAVSPGGAEANRSSSLDDILDLRLDGLTPAGATAAVARSGSAAGAFSDPWAARDDQFGAAAAAPVPAADPWGMPKKQAPVAPPTLADPWAPPPVAGAVGGGLGLDLGDPWAPPAAPTASDPWGATKSSDPNPDPFDMLGMRSTLQGSPSPSFGQNGKLNGEASDSSSGSGGPKKKKPEDFLGENSALVNLDNLVSKPAPAASTGFGDGGLNNPFALGPFTAAATANPAPQQQNPFQSVAAPRPTLNEMRMNQGTGDGTWGRVYPDLANPFV